MTPHVRTLALGGTAGLAVALASLLFVFQASAGQTIQTQSGLEYRLFVPHVARDGVLAPPPQGGPIPPADPSYCPGTSTGGPPSPPNSVLGLLTIGGAPAPAGTLVQIMFDDKVGPGIRTAEAGGYRIDYAAGGAACSNKVGAEMSILVNGTPFSSGVDVGDGAANPFLRFDIAAP